MVIACQKGHVDVVALLLDRGAVVNQARVRVCVWQFVVAYMLLCTDGEAGEGRGGGRRRQAGETHPGTA